MKLRYLDGWIEGRRRVAARYDALLEVTGDAIALPRRDPRREDVPNPTWSAWPSAIALTAMRDAGIDARAYYDRLLPDEPASPRAVTIAGTFRARRRRRGASSRCPRTRSSRRRIRSVVAALLRTVKGTNR